MVLLHQSIQLAERTLVSVKDLSVCAITTSFFKEAVNLTVT